MAWKVEVIDLHVFTGMLKRAGVGFVFRPNHGPEGMTVQVEHPHECGAGFHVTEWAFDAAGRLVGVTRCKVEVD